VFVSVFQQREMCAKFNNVHIPGNHIILEIIEYLIGKRRIRKICIFSNLVGLKDCIEAPQRPDDHSKDKN